MRPFCATTSGGCLFCLSIFGARPFFLAHSNNAKVNFCLNDDEDDEVGESGNIYLHDWRRNVNGCGPTPGYAIRWWRRLSNYGAAFYYFLTRALFHGLFFPRSTKPEEVKMFKFPTLLFLFSKIGNPSMGRLLPTSGWFGAFLGYHATDYDGAAGRRWPDSHDEVRPAPVCIHRTSNSRKWSFPHRAPDIKLLTVAIWRGGMESFHFTVQILSLTLSLSQSVCLFLPSVTFLRVGNRTDCLPFAHNPPNFRPLLFYCIQSGWFDGLLTNLLFFLRFMFLDYLLRDFLCYVWASVGFYNLTRNGATDVLFRLFFLQDFLHAGFFFSYYLQLDRFVLCRSLTLVGGYFFKFNLLRATNKYDLHYWLTWALDNVAEHWKSRI